jgi:hypothetical protein
LHGFETSSLTLTEGHRLKVFVNGVLREILGPKRKEVTGEWRGQLNKERHYLFPKPNIIRVSKSRRMKCTGHVARMKESRGANRVLVQKTEETKPLGRPRRKWANNIEVDL